MFYSAQILAKKGPLGTIWIAAHHDKKYLKKQQVSGTDILESCGASVFSCSVDLTRAVAAGMAATSPSAPSASIRVRQLAAEGVCRCDADRIISPEAPLALRLSGQLMLGVVRIYYKQVEYLEHDAQGALVKLRQVGL